MFVVTADQRGSRTSFDAVPDALRLLESVPLHSAFERTVGDEIQGVFDRPEGVLQAAMLLSAQRRWSIGVGVGAATINPGETSREGRGPAFVLARRAVESAKQLNPSLVVAGEGGSADNANALWRLLGSIWSRRTALGWEAIFALEAGDGTQQTAARNLGISQQAMSERLRTAMWANEADVHPLACELLIAAGSAQ